MIGPIERIAKTSAIITRQTGKMVNGVPCEEAISCSVYELPGAMQEFSEYGSVKMNKAVLVAPILGEPLTLPASITIGNVKYDVMSIVQYRTLSGHFFGYKLMLAGA